MNGLLVHNSVSSALRTISNHPPHAVGIIGPKGAGKAGVALELANTLLPRRYHQNGLLILKPSGTSYGIEQIRGLKQFLSLKQPGSDPIRRVLILEDAHLMGHEAQNALLKTIEEPPMDTVCILTLTHESSMLPTILSRLQHLQVTPVTISEAEQYFSSKDGKQLTRNFHLSGGWAGLLVALMNDETEHPLLGALSEAKELLTAPAFERLKQVDALSKDKEHLADILFCMRRVVDAGLKKDNLARSTSILRSITTAEAALKSSVNAKLTLSELFLHL